jgi:hypothetical protein
MQRRAAVGLALAALAGCYSSPEARTQKAGRQIASWQAIAALADSLRGAGSLPGRYADALRARAERGVAQARRRT